MGHGSGVEMCAIQACILHMKHGGVGCLAETEGPGEWFALWRGDLQGVEWGVLQIWHGCIEKNGANYVSNVQNIAMVGG